MSHPFPPSAAPRSIRPVDVGVTRFGEPAGRIAPPDGVKVVREPGRFPVAERGRYGAGATGARTSCGVQGVQGVHGAYWAYGANGELLAGHALPGCPVAGRL